MLDPRALADWQALRARLALFDLDALKQTLQQCPWAAATSRPRLLVDYEAFSTIRDRLEATVAARLRIACEAMIRVDPDAVSDRLTTADARSARRVAEGFAILQNPLYADWVRRRIDALLMLPTWMAEVHRGMCRTCDHVMANVAADVAMAHDLLGDAADAGFTQRVVGGVRRLHFEPYLEAARSRCEFWARDECLTNWKIMTHGESGLAVCAFHTFWPEAREALALAADGVIQVLDVIPPTGDWPEGIGYWFTTLFMGLRFGYALRRLTGGAVDLLQHPRLAVTGEFGESHVTPSGKIFNYGDNADDLKEYASDAFMLLGVEQRKPAWISVARRFPSDSPLALSLNHSGETDVRLPDGHWTYAASGLGIMRRGGTFIGMRSGDSTVGHAHLDSNTLIAESDGALWARDSGIWPYAHYLGFFDCGRQYGGKRWNFDGLATLGHNCILVDGQGQAFGAEYAGRMIGSTAGEGWMCIEGDASACYPGRLRQWRRSLLLAGEHILVIRDVIECDGARHVEWLLQAGGEMRDDGADTCLRIGDRQARLIPLLPDRSAGWRVSDVVRRSHYENSNTGAIENPTIRYRGFSLLAAGTAFEFLFVLRMDGGERPAIGFGHDDTGWQMVLPDAGIRVVPRDAGLSGAAINGKAESRSVTIGLEGGVTK